MNGLHAPRVKPTALLGWAIGLGYGAAFFVVESLSGVGYTEIAESAENLWRAMVVPLAAATVVLAAITTYLGWWQPALHEPGRVRSTWVLAIPIVLTAAVLMGIDYPQLGVLGPAYLLALAAGTAMVGFCEELVYRGLTLIALRGSHAEPIAVLTSALMFGLLHGLNLFLGQDLLRTILQVAFAFALGLVFYATRRATGGIVVPMVLHALWDFGSFTFIGGLATTGLDLSRTVFALPKLPLSALAFLLTLIALPSLVAPPQPDTPDPTSDPEPDPPKV